jgi:hypothetical protein
MNSFKDFNIKPALKGFVGDKIKISKLLNKEIIVHAYKIADSKFGDKGNKCLQIQLEMNNTKYVVFTGSLILMDTIRKIPELSFPFATTIIEEDERYEFT